MFKKRKLYEIVKKLMAETGRAVPICKDCTYRHRKGIEWLEFYGAGDDFSLYKVTAEKGPYLGNEGRVYIDEKRNGRTVREDQYFYVCEDGTYTEHRQNVFA